MCLDKRFSEGQENKMKKSRWFYVPKPSHRLIFLFFFIEFEIQIQPKDNDTFIKTSLCQTPFDVCESDDNDIWKINVIVIGILLKIEMLIFYHYV